MVVSAIVRLEFEAEFVGTRREGFQFIVEKRPLSSCMGEAGSLRVDLDSGFSATDEPDLFGTDEREGLPFFGRFRNASNNYRIEEARALFWRHQRSRSDRLLLNTAAFRTNVIRGLAPHVFNPLPTGELFIPQMSEPDRELPAPLAVFRDPGATNRFSASTVVGKRLYENQRPLPPFLCRGQQNPLLRRGVAPVAGE